MTLKIISCEMLLTNPRCLWIERVTPPVFHDPHVLGNVKYETSSGFEQPATAQTFLRFFQDRFYNRNNLSSFQPMDN